ncbi:MAG: nucleotide pyrophosphatase/phosphodiesterase family protein [Smithella sp.]
MNKSMVLLDVAGLDLQHVKMSCMPNLATLLNNGNLFKMLPIFPPVTLPVQASITTGLFPRDHGIVANGFFFPERLQVSFWEQSAMLVQGSRIWDRLKSKNPDFRSAALFFQNTMFAGCDAVITSMPLHIDSQLIPWCYSKPAGLYEDITGRLGPFNLQYYWGPLASIESSRWIAKAAVEVIDMLQPNLLMVYLPHLDYILQRFGPDRPCIAGELEIVDNEIGRIIDKAKENDKDTSFIILSEYKFQKVNGDIPINRILRRQGFLNVRPIQGREYLDVELSEAFAMVDHQIAHIYIHPGREEEVKNCLREVKNIELVLNRNDQKIFGIDHSRSGLLVAVSNKDKWFSYPWWEDRSVEPFFAPLIDIHNKPGYDPLELILEPGMTEISQNTSLVKGSHGYPALPDEGEVPFIISGVDSRQVPENMSAIHVAKIIESYFA